MKKLLFVISLLTCINHSGFGQNDVKPIGSKEFGFNATSLINNIIPFDSDVSINTLDNLLFFKVGNGKTYFRSAINLDYQASEQDNADFTASLALLKLGFERKIRLSKSWVFHSGAEAFGSLATSTTESNDQFFNDFTSKQTLSRFGLAGIYGIQWMINDRIAIGTEGYLSFSAIQQESKNTSQGTSNSSSSKALDLSLNLPNSLLLSVYF